MCCFGVPLWTLLQGSRPCSSVKSFWSELPCPWFSTPSMSVISTVGTSSYPPLSEWTHCSSSASDSSAPSLALGHSSDATGSFQGQLADLCCIVTQPTYKLWEPEGWAILKKRLAPQATETRNCLSVVSPTSGEEVIRSQKQAPKKILQRSFKVSDHKCPKCLQSKQKSRSYTFRQKPPCLPDPRTERCMNGSDICFLLQLLQEVSIRDSLLCAGWLCRPLF